MLSASANRSEESAKETTNNNGHLAFRGSTTKPRMSALLSKAALSTCLLTGRTGNADVLSQMSLPHSQEESTHFDLSLVSRGVRMIGIVTDPDPVIQVSAELKPFNNPNFSLGLWVEQGISRNDFSPNEIDAKATFSLLSGASWWGVYQSSLEGAVWLFPGEGSAAVPTLDWGVKISPQAKDFKLGDFNLNYAVHLLNGDAEVGNMLTFKFARGHHINVNGASSIEIKPNISLVCSTGVLSGNSGCSTLNPGVTFSHDASNLRLEGSLTYQVALDFEKFGTEQFLYGGLTISYTSAGNL